MLRFRSAAMTAVLVALVTSLASTGSAGAAGCTTSWTSAGGGDWNDAGNWDNGLPGPLSDACITLSGTYGVSLTGTITNIHALTLGGASGTQTLSLAGDAGKNTNLTLDATADIGAQGVLVLTTSHEDHTSAFWAKGGTTNAGTIIAAAGPGTGLRDLRGPLTNNGSIAIQAPSSYGSGAGDVLVNHGTVDLAAPLRVPVGSGVTNALGGSIAGTDKLTLFSAHFTQAGGTTSNPNPVELEDSGLSVTGGGSGRFLWHGASAPFSGGLRRGGQRLTVEGTCAAPAATISTASYTNSGTITLTSSGCPRAAELFLGSISKSVINRGTLSALTGAGGTRTVSATLDNRGKVELGAGVVLDSLAYAQESAKTLKTWVASLTSFGQLSTGPATLDGTIAIARTPGFDPPVGSSFTIVGASALSGSFAKATGAVIAGTKYFLPTYTSTEAQLVVTSASLAISPASGPPGTTVTLTGAGFPPGRDVAPSFKDHLRTITSYPSVTTDAAGGFTAQITVPATAAAGSGTVRVKSGYTGVQATKPFLVTP